MKFILKYFFPVEKKEGSWHFKNDLTKEMIQVYLIRNGVPFMLFWGLEIYFLATNLLLFTICLFVCLPFAFSFGLLVREYRDKKLDY